MRNRVGLSNPAIVALAMVAMLIVGGILWAIVGPKMTPRPKTTPTPRETVAEATPTPTPSPSPQGTPVPVGKMVGRWTDAIDPDVTLVVESEGRSLKILEPAALAGTFAPSGRRYAEAGKGRSLELTDAGELVLTTEKKGEDWETKLFNRATDTPTPEATPTPEPTPVAETPTPAPTPTVAEEPSPEPLLTPSPAGEVGSPEAFLQQYYEAINKDDFQAAYELRSLRSRKSTTYPEFIHIWSNNRTIQLVDATVTSNDGATAELEIHLRADDISRTTHKSTITNYTGKVKLVLEDEKWCYDGGDFKAETP